MDKIYKNCQSCGMPLKRDEKGGGSNSDGTISTMYCSYCYEKGEFIYKGNSVAEFQEYSKQKMMEGGHSRFFSWLFTRGMSRLSRWKNKNQ
ncbi:MAG: zinc ribbon domain-containing protein [Saprospiraceae bacterium]